MDWEHERFSMDDGLSKAVKEVFVRLYEEGLIYRGKRLVNWDPVLHTAVSDLEVLSEKRTSGMMQPHLAKIIEKLTRKSLPASVQAQPRYRPESKQRLSVAATKRPEGGGKPTWKSRRMPRCQLASP